MDEMSLIDNLIATIGAQYRIERELEGGGMSRVFLAHDTALERRVVVKVLSAPEGATLSVERFEREILVSAGLQHPHIVSVLAAGNVNGVPYFVMPFVDGESLAKRLTGDKRLTSREAVPILRDVARGLAYAHERGIVHRDIKPDNILLSGGSALITDFGVAKALVNASKGDQERDQALTQAGFSLGTPAYMAPEQAAADAHIDHRADLYSFGAMAYEMLTSDPPFTNRPVSQIIAAHITEKPKSLSELDPNVPVGLVSIVMSCLEKIPNDRPNSAQDIVDALERPEVASGPIPTDAAPSMRRRLQVRAAAVVGVLALVVALVFIMSQPGLSDMAEGESIAVLPFENLGGNVEDQYFADGLADQITTALGKVPQLRVASRTSAFAFRERSETAQDIGRTLKVSTLLEGTVRRSGPRVRLTAQLVNTMDGLTLWSETFEYQVADVFAAQDSLTGSIVGALKDAFGTDMSMAQVSVAGTNDVEAYDLYLRGRFFFRQRSLEEIRQALEYFERAAARDPGYAQAYAGIADAYGLLPVYGQVSIDSTLPLALRAADRAIALDTLLAEAYASRASLRTRAWMWAAAERDFRRAIELDPNYPNARQWYGEYLLLHGRIEEAVQQLETAAQHDPLSPVIAASLSAALGIAGRGIDADREGQRALALAPSFPIGNILYGAAKLYLGETEEAVPLLEDGFDLSGSIFVRGLLGFAYGRLGQREEAMRHLAAVEASSESWTNAALGRIYLGLDDVARALESLQKAADERSLFFSSESMMSSSFDSIRSTDEFARIVGQVGLNPRIIQAQ